MVEKKYPKYVSTDMDMWNSADESYFYVVKNEAKPFIQPITSIVEDALESGLLREATEQEIEKYLLKNDIDRQIEQRNIDIGKTYEETLSNYNKYKENLSNSKTQVTKKSKNIKPKVITTPIADEIETIEPVKKLTPTENALKQKASIRTDNM